jgi:hypothetical protein
MIDPSIRYLVVCRLQGSARLHPAASIGGGTGDKMAPVISFSPYSVNGASRPRSKSAIRLFGANSQFFGPHYQAGQHGNALPDRQGQPEHIP